MEVKEERKRMMGDMRGRNERERRGGIMNQRKRESLANKSLKYYTSAVDSMFNNVNLRKAYNSKTLSLGMMQQLDKKVARFLV